MIYERSVFDILCMDVFHEFNGILNKRPRKIHTYDLEASFSFFSTSASGIYSKTLNKPAEPGAMSRILPLGSMITKVGNKVTP